MIFSKKLNRRLNQVQKFQFFHYEFFSQMFLSLLNNDNHLINWIKTEIKLQNERNWIQMELQRTGQEISRLFDGFE